MAKKEIAEDVNKILLEEIKKISERLDALEKQPEPPKPAAPAPSAPPSDTYIPPDYQYIVDTVLNNRFGIQLKYHTDAPQFDFDILVPQDYSNSGKPHWETYKEDRRSKVILNALGVNGVRDWATQVYTNFDPETKARISADRAIPN